MTDQDFKETLEAFAESGLQHAAQRRLVVDVRELKHGPSADILAWRDEVTMPKFNRAGVRRLAWVWPGTTPANMPTGPNDKFENRYFAGDAEALAWVLR
jgi:hypothetical protein